MTVRFLALTLEDNCAAVRQLERSKVLKENNVLNHRYEVFIMLSISK